MESILPIVLSAVTLISLAALVMILMRRTKGGDESAQVAVLEERLSAGEAERVRLNQEIAGREGNIAGLQESLQGKIEEISELRRRLAISENDLRNQREQGEERLKALKDDQEAMANRFKVLADGILKENTKVFRQQNAEGLGEILKPLKERLGEFQKTIKENYETEGKERHSLRNEVQKLAEMNARLSQEASNLTNALKGENKTQGNWGEMILERILEVSGLRRGEEYTVQESHTREDGSRSQPDVIIHLPEQRFMVIDSKVSLNAYDDYMNAPDEGAADEALKKHIDSVRAHIKGLSAKEYQNIHEDRSPDFVVMFVPIESAFLLAISEDGRLWEDAWKANVLLVSASTLLFVMRIVMQLWRQDKQSKSAKEIAQRGAALYEKFVNFVNDFDAVGKRLDMARKVYEDAKGKLSEGRGNLIRQAEMLREMGVGTSKRMPEAYLEAGETGESGFLELESPEG